MVPPYDVEILFDDLFHSHRGMRIETVANAEELFPKF